jgi:hypothetical protein
MSIAFSQDRLAGGVTRSETTAVGAVVGQNGEIGAVEQPF